MYLRNKTRCQTSVPYAAATPSIRVKAVDPSATLEADRVTARALGAAVEDGHRLSLGQAFCFQLVTKWWQSLAADDGDCPPLRPPLAPFHLARLPDSANTLADRMGHAAAQLDIEAGTYQIGLTYTTLLPPHHRARLGIYYTPPTLTARLTDQATAAGVDWSHCRVLDPACGGGAFLTPVAQRILDALPDSSPQTLIDNIATRLRGYEIDPFAAWLTQVALDAMLLPACRRARRQLPIVVTVCDSLRRQPPDERFDLVIGNPPYGRVNLEPEEREHYRRSLHGHANLYGLFTDVALDYAKPGGVIAYVTPTSFLAGQYFKNLRELLARTAPLATVDFVAVRRGVFEDVLQETLLATYKRGAEPATAAVYQVTPVNGDELKVEKSGTFTLPSDPSQPWLLPRAAKQARIVTSLRAMPDRLADWGYTVSTGPLVWNRHKQQLADMPGEGRLPLIWAEAVTADGRFVWRAAKKNHTRYFEPRENDEWLITRSPCVLLQRTTAKEQHRRLIAATLPVSFVAEHGAVVIENHLNMLRPTIGGPRVPPTVLAAFLNSAAADQAFRCVNGSVAVSAYELEAFPLPASTALTELAELVRRRATRAHRETACARLYALEVEV
jgi:adenine-specific DNA-methyltransferase